MIKRVILLALTVICGMLGYSQTASEIIEQYKQATNEQKMDSYDNIVRRTTASYYGVKVFMYEVFSKSQGYKCFTYTKAPMVAESVTVELFVNGMGFSFVKEWQRASELVDKGLAKRSEQYSFGPKNYENQIVRYIGVEEGCNVVAFVDGKNSSKMYFDAQSHYIVKNVSNVFYHDPVTNSEKQTGSTMIISNYKDIDGFFQPTKVVMEGKTGESVFDGYWFNVEFPENFFEPSDDVTNSPLISQNDLLLMLGAGKVSTAKVTTPQATKTEPVYNNPKPVVNNQPATPKVIAPKKEAPYKQMHVHIAWGGSMRILSNTKANQIEGFDILMDQYVSGNFRGGILYFLNKEKPEGLCLGGALNIDYSPTVSIDFTRTEEYPEYNAVEYFYIYTKGSMAKVGAELSLGYSFCKSKKRQVIPYFSMAPLLSIINTKPYDFPDKKVYTEYSFYSYPDDTYIKSRKLALEFNLGAKFIFNKFYLNPFVSFSSTTYNLKINTNDLDAMDDLFGRDATDYEHDIKYSAPNLNVLLGLYF